MFKRAAAAELHHSYSIWENNNPIVSTIKPAETLEQAIIEASQFPLGKVAVLTHFFNIYPQGYCQKEHWACFLNEKSLSDAQRFVDDWARQEIAGLVFRTKYPNG